MKLRQVPDDFRVEELSNFAVSQSVGEYMLFVLEKRGLESFQTLAHIARKWGVPLKDIGVAGLKDRHAVTRQYLTIPSRYAVEGFSEANLSLTFQGYVSDKISSGDLSGNRFEIVVRDLTKGELPGVYQKAETVASLGVPNFFDSQRFGSVARGQFIVKAILTGDCERAVKIFLTHYTKTEDRRLKEEKRRILGGWGNLSGLRINNKVFASVISRYLKTGDWLSAYRRIPSNLREMFVSAYQSYLWNECVKEVLRQTVDERNLYSIEYNAGSLLFYRKLSTEEKAGIPETFKTISHTIRPTAFEQKIIEAVLAREGLTPADFDIRKKTGSFFKTHERSVIIAPTDFTISESLKDELNGGGGKTRFKVSVSFTLPKGSYATVVTKRLFNH